jgi:integrase
VTPKPRESDTETASQKKESYTFDELLARYESIHLPTIALETRRRYELDINRRIREYFRFRPLETITPMLIESFRAKIMKDIEPKSVNNCVCLLAAIFRKGQEWDMLEKNPVRVRRLKIAEEKYTWWNEKEDILKFLEAAKECRYHTVYRLALETGMRLGEIVGLSKQDVSFERNQIHIHRQWLNREECYGPTKGRRERFVTFHPESDLKDALREAIKKSPDPEAIFVTEEGTRVRPRRLAARHFMRVVKRAGVPRIRFHDMRHTFASWYMIEVGDIWSLKALLGHADIQTTQRYAHLSERNYRLPVLSWTATSSLPRTCSTERGNGGGGFPLEVPTLNSRSKTKI